MEAEERYRWFVIRAASSRGDVRARIVDVAARLMQEQGVAAVTTRGVAEAAGVQAPAIYRLFGDKDGLLDAVAEHVMATYVAAKAAVVAAASVVDLDPLQDLRAGWDTQMEFGLANPALFGLLNDPGRVLPSPAARSGRQVLEARVHRVALAGRLRVPEQRAVDLIHAAGTGTIQALLSMPVEHRDTTLSANMYDAVLRQILTSAPDPVEQGPIGPAVALRACTSQLEVLSQAERHLLAEWLDRVVAGLEQDHS